MAPTTVEEKIQVIQQKTGSSRKAAIRKLKASQRAGHKVEVSNEKAVDVKSAAANDKTPVGGYAKGNRTRAANKLPATAAIAVLDTAVAEAVKELHTAPKAAKTPAAPKERLTPEQVGAARKEGIRLFQLAGKPKPEDFLAVYGPKGPRMTWVDRAKAAGLASAEEAATKFQAMLAKVVKK